MKTGFILASEPTQAAKTSQSWRSQGEGGSTRGWLTSWVSRKRGPSATEILSEVSPSAEALSAPPILKEDKDKLVFSFGPSANPASLPKQEPARANFSDWETLREALRIWILAAGIILLVILSLAAARWIFTSSAFEGVASISDMRQMIAGVISPAPKRSQAVRYDNSNATKLRNTGTIRPRRKIAPSESGATTSTGPNRPTEYATPKQFEVMDAQNRRRFLPVRGATATAPLGQDGEVETTKVLGGEPTSGAPSQKQRGLVWLHPATQVPQKMLLPEYPALALQENIQGRVVVDAVIGKDGTLQNIRSVGPPSLSAAVLESVKKWRYQPHYENGVPVEVETQITVDFED